MRKLTYCSIFAVMAFLISAQPLVGQEEDEGGGGVIDWIHRLSGPSMLGPTGSYFREWETIRLRVNVSGRLAVGFKDQTLRDNHGINMLALQPTLEVPIMGPLEIGAGVAINRLGGKGHDAVWHLSVPFFAQLRSKVMGSENWFVRVGLGGHFFPSFDDTDFLEAESDQPGVRVKTDGGEVSFGLILGFDYRRAKGDESGVRE